MRRRYIKIQDCFTLQCPQRWNHLEPTKDKGVKYCAECSRNVYKAKNKKELLKLGEEGKCAAYFAYEDVLLGMVNPYLKKTKKFLKIIFI